MKIVGFTVPHLHCGIAVFMSAYEL